MQEKIQHEVATGSIPGFPRTGSFLPKSAPSHNGAIYMWAGMTPQALTLDAASKTTGSVLLKLNETLNLEGSASDIEITKSYKCVGHVQPTNPSPRFRVYALGSPGTVYPGLYLHTQNELAKASSELVEFTSRLPSVALPKSESNVVHEFCWTGRSTWTPC